MGHNAGKLAKYYKKFKEIKMNPESKYNNVETYTKIYNAVHALLYVCDGASTKDGHGFNKFDAQFVRDVMYKNWTPNIAHAIWRKLKKSN